MSVVKRIVCLANSRKLSGRCIAGKELIGESPGLWIRPVSARPTEEVSEHERQYEDGSDPQVLDVIDVPLQHAQSRSYQAENWLLDPHYYWTHVGQVGWDDLDLLADDPATLWFNGPSTYHGRNDCIPVEQAETLRTSLFLLRLDAVELSVFAPSERFGNPKRRVQARFSHRRIPYWLRVTDPDIEREYLRGRDGEYRIGSCYATVSLGEPFKGSCYKLVAALITPERAGV